MDLFPLRTMPKLHFGCHALEAWVETGVLLSCFSPERKHRRFKKNVHLCTQKGMLYSVGCGAPSNGEQLCSW
eukprot:1695173-Pyramimonas_sp.AAC.1